MTKTVSRSDLYDLVWSEPLREVAKQFEVSDVALKKACAKAQVPTPVQGHWNKVAAGKSTVQTALPPRPPGMRDAVTIGGGGRLNYWNPVSREELLGPIPPEPVFEESLERVRARIEADLGKVACPRKDARHPEVRKLLDKDDIRKQKAAGQDYVFAWDQPRFTAPMERRRLEILNSLFLAVGRFGGKPTLRGDQAREVMVTFDHQHIYLELEAASVRKATKADVSPDKLLTLRILLGYGTTECRASWIDGDDRLEQQMTNIVAELVLTAEIQLRESAEHSHRWRIERKGQLEEEDRKQALELERQEVERQEKLERARIKALVQAADDFRTASDIRAYVTALGAAIPAEDSRRQSEFAVFSSWALARADRIDPALKAAFIDPAGEIELNEPEPDCDPDSYSRRSQAKDGYWPRPWWTRRR